MTTSGTTNWELDIADVIEESFERIGIELRTSHQAKSARRSLNLLLQDLGNRQINLWKIAEISVTMVQGTTVYALNDAVLDIETAILRRNSQDLRMNRLGRSTYETRPNKLTQARPSQFYINRVRPVQLKVYPAPDNSTDVVILQTTTRIEDITALTQTLDVPVRIQPAMISGLSYYLSLKFKPEMAQMYKGIFEEELGRALEEGRERAPLRLTPAVGRI
tara:strand:- start:322 stop:981 length:660 start_codon:yes stop_codon:yes gene_type:complete